MINIYKYTVEQEYENFDTGEMTNVVEFAGETEEEARAYVEMAGWAIVEYIGIKAKPQTPKSEYKYASYVDYCNAMGIHV